MPKPVTISKAVAIGRALFATAPADLSGQRDERLQWERTARAVASAAAGSDDDLYVRILEVAHCPTLGS